MLLPVVFVVPSVPSYTAHEWRQTASLTAARMRQQLILGCPPSRLKGRYRVSNSSSWLDTKEVSVQGQSSKQVNQTLHSFLIVLATNTLSPQIHQVLLYLTQIPADPTLGSHSFLDNIHCILSLRET